MEDRRKYIYGRLEQAKQEALTQKGRDAREYDFRRTWRSEVPYACMIIAAELYVEELAPIELVRHFWRLYRDACEIMRFPERWRTAHDPSPADWEHMQRLFGLEERDEPYNVRLRQHKTA